MPAEKITVVYNWADESIFRPEPRDASLARKLGLADKLTLMYAGNLGPMQGVEALVHAAAKLEGRGRLPAGDRGDGPA